MLFGFVVFFGAPYLPTLKRQMMSALELLELQPGDTLIELGCGDGRVLTAAAKKGIHVVGYELNPILAAVAWLRTRKHKDLVQVIWGNFWRKSWPEADGIFVFLLDKYMYKLDKKVIQEQKRWNVNSAETKPKKRLRSIKLVSFAFQIPQKRPIKKQNGLFLYKY